MQTISPGLRPVLIALLLVGTLAGLFGAYKRFHVEAGNRRVELAVEWQEVNLLAQTAHQPLPEVLAKLKEAHVSTLVIYEDTLSSLEQAGVVKAEQQASQVTSVNVYDPLIFERLKSVLKLRGLILDSDALQKTPARTIVRALDPQTQPSNIMNHGGSTIMIRPTPTDEIAVSADYTTLRNMGIGLPPGVAQIATQNGFRVAGRISNFPGTSQATAFSLLQSLKAAGATTVIFNGEEVLGYRGSEKYVASLLKPDATTGKSPIPDLNYGEVEFGKQKGDEKLSAALNGDYISRAQHSDSGTGATGGGRARSIVSL